MANEYLKIVVLAAMANLIKAAPQGLANNSDAMSGPRMVSREKWKARPARSTETLPVSPAPYAVIHHGGIASYCYDQANCSRIVRSYQNYHLDDHGWADIGYNFVIGEDGNVYEGRGWDSVGAHAPKYNQQSIGICVIGDFTNIMPNQAALQTLHSLLNYGVELGKLSADYQVIGHRQTRPTECPGETFYKYVKSLPNWTGNPIPYTYNKPGSHSAESENLPSR